MIKITTKERTVSVRTPYHPEFPASARDMGGRWVAPDWVFDARDEKRVRDLCLDIWGTDGTPCELVTLRVSAGRGVWDGAGKSSEIYLAGRLVAKVFGRDDQRARLGDGVVVIQGRFYGGGSRANPACDYADGTQFELRDVPREIAEREYTQNPERIEILGSPVSPAPGDVQVSPEIQALIDERASISARLAEIDAALLEAVPKRREVPVFEVAHELLDND